MVGVAIDMRPLYETQKDRDNEEIVAKFLAEKFNCEYFKLPIAYKADYAFLRDDKVVGLVEVRCRNVKFSDYETIMLSVHKRMDCLALAQSLDVPVIFAIHYDDGIYSIDLSKQPDYASVGGRNQVRDWQDIEIVFHYKTGRLQKWS